MPSHVSADSPGVFASLADIVRRGSSPTETYAAICVAATLTVPGCDHASLMICRDGTFRTAAVSDAIAGQVDNLELASGGGPCRDAICSRRAQLEPNLTAGTRWPALTARIVAETPVRGMMSVRLPIDHANIGALNLFSDATNAFDDTSIGHAVVLGAFTTVAANALAHNDEAATLRRDLTGNRAIGKAIGMLMVLNNTSDDDAYDALRRTSQTANIKLADVAADVIRGHLQRGSDKSA